VSADPPKTVPSSGGKVPLVSEVLERLVADLGGEASRRPAFFQAALQVCSEELRAVKGGGRAASLDDLVARARKLLGAAPPKPAAAPPPAIPPPEPARPARAAAAATPTLPFPDDEPTKQHVFPESEPAARQRDIFEDDLFTIDESTDSEAAAGTAAIEPALPIELAPPPPAPPRPTPAPPSPTVFHASAPSPPPPPRAVPAHDEPLPIAAPAVRDLFGSFSDQAATPLETPTAGELDEGLADASFEPYLPEESPEPRSRRTLLAFALGGTALVVVVVAALWLFGGALRNTVLPAPEIAAPTPAATPRYQSVFEPDGEAPATGAAPQPVNVAAVPAQPPPQPTAVPTAAPAAPSARAARPPALAPDVAVMVSRDWAGRAPAYGIHFSSYQERARAERDAAQIGAAHGRPAVVAEVDLGGRGRWHRVVLIGFADAAEAKAYHARLRARGTPGVGGVYVLVAPE
jgi:hypothetical protein